MSAVFCAFAVCDGAARGEPARRCLTPAAGQFLQELVGTGKLRSALRDDFTVKGGNVGGDRIELTLEDRAHRSYGITLALAESSPAKPDGKGGRFLFYLAKPPGVENPEASAALLAAASLVDQAIPDAALAPCGEKSGGTEQRAEAEAARDDRSGQAPPAPGAPNNGQPRSSRAFALASAAAEVAVLVIAIVFGLWTIAAIGPLSSRGRLE